MPDVDLVIHGAWVTTDPEALGITVADYVLLNIGPLLQTLAFAARVKARAFVFLSSSGVFDVADAKDGLTDDVPPTAASAYAVAKRAGESLTAAAVGDGVAAHVVRLGYLYGPEEVARHSRQRVSLVARWIDAARAS